MASRGRLGAFVGRQKVTHSTGPYEAGYVKSISRQLDKVIANYTSLISELRINSEDVIYDALEPTFQLSQKYCPKDTRRLVNSGFIEKAKDKARVVLGYAKQGNPPYAAMVHELTHLNHKSPTRSKFLLAALENDEPRIRDRLVKGYAKLLESGKIKKR